MIKIQFYKYHGTGNDFILIDNRTVDIKYLLSGKQIAHLCNRRIGIGADGLILMESSQNSDFKMVYFNSDGLPGSMCGNGGRCIVAFAAFLGIEKEEYIFEASDGTHKAKILSNGYISLTMNDITSWEKLNNDLVMDTGSPHFVRFLHDKIHEVDIIKIGKSIRYSEPYKKEGINVNLVQPISKNHIQVRTYERGVEDETSSCGTGVTAAAIAHQLMQDPTTTGAFLVKVATNGGELIVSGEFDQKKFINIRLEGPATQVFDGKVSLS